MHQGNLAQQQVAWERAAGEYLHRRGADVHEVTYGALCPGEGTLGLLGDLRGRRVLDVGCGAGNNAVACTLAGGDVTALDFSPTMLEAAHRLAQAHKVAVQFLPCDIASGVLPPESRYDIVLAISVLSYVEDLATALGACRRVIAQQGRMIASIDHPLRTCFVDDETGDLAAVPLQSYYQTQALTWGFDAHLPMRSFHRTTAKWLHEFGAAGFRLERLLEPPVPTDLAEELWPQDSPLGPLQAIPHTLIFVLAPS